MCNVRSLLFITTALLCSQTYLLQSSDNTTDQNDSIKASSDDRGGSATQVLELLSPVNGSQEGMRTCIEQLEHLIKELERKFKSANITPPNDKTTIYKIQDLPEGTTVKMNLSLTHLQYRLDLLNLLAAETIQKSNQKSDAETQTTETDPITSTNNDTNTADTTGRFSELFDGFQEKGAEYLTSCMAQVQTLQKELLLSLRKSSDENESNKKENSEEKSCSLPALLKELETTQQLLSQLQKKQKVAEEQNKAFERDFTESQEGLEALAAMHTSLFEDVESLTAASKVETADAGKEMDEEENDKWPSLADANKEWKNDHETQTDAQTETDNNDQQRTQEPFDQLVNKIGLLIDQKNLKDDEDDDTIRTFHAVDLETLIAKDKARCAKKEDKQFTDEEIESFCKTFHDNLGALRTNVENFFSTNHDKITVLPYSQQTLPEEEFETLFKTASQMLKQLQNKKNLLLNERNKLTDKATEEEEEEARNQKSAALEKCEKAFEKNEQLTTKVRNLFFQSAEGFNESAEKIDAEYMTYLKENPCKNDHVHRAKTPHFYCVLKPVVKQMHDHLLSTTITDPEDVRTTIGAFSLLHILLEHIRCLEAVEGRLGGQNPFATAKQSVATSTGDLPKTEEIEYLKAQLDESQKREEEITNQFRRYADENKNTIEQKTALMKASLNNTQAIIHSVPEKKKAASLTLREKIQKGAFYSVTGATVLALIYGRGYYSHSAFLPGQELFNKGFEKTMSWASKKGAISFLHNALRAPLAAAKVEKIETIVTVVQKPTLTGFASIFPERWIFEVKK